MLLQNAEEGPLKQQDMVTKLSSTVACLKQSEQKLMEGIKSLILVCAEVLNKSKQSTPDTPPARQEMFATAVSRHLLGLQVQNDKYI